MPGRRIPIIGGILVVAFILLLGALLLRNLNLSDDSLADSTTLTIISGDVLVQQSEQTGFNPALDGMPLEAEYRIRTGQGSHALITFFEGSTTELEPETEVKITSLLRGRSSRPSATAVAFRQVSGTTWNYILAAADPSSIHEIAAPTAVVQGHGTLLKIRVDPATGRTEVQAIDGAAAVSAQGVKVQLAPYTQTVVEENQAPGIVMPVPPLSERLVFTADAPVWARVVDPAGRAAGFISPGLQVNQIPGSLVSLPFANPTTIELPANESGRYNIVLDGAREGTYRFIIQGISRDVPVFTQGVQGTIKPGQRFFGSLTIIAQNDRLTGGQLGNFVALTTEQGPGKFVRTRLAVASVESTATAVALQGSPASGFLTPLVPQTPTTVAARTATPTASPTEAPTETAPPEETSTATAMGTTTATNVPPTPSATALATVTGTPGTPTAPTATAVPTTEGSPTQVATPIASATQTPTAAPDVTSTPPAPTATQGPPAEATPTFTHGPAP